MVFGQMSWGFLPREIRLMILEALNQDGHRVAHYATFCREWQTFIEREVFSQLNVNLSRLNDLGAMVCRSKRLVKYLWLCIELQEYDCSQCEVEETDSWHEANTAIIQSAISQLFSILSAWDPSEKLLLDISVHSPSDAKHHFKYIQFGSGALAEIDYARHKANIHDTHHGWFYNQQVSPPSYRSIYRLFENIEMPSDFWKDLPAVTAVTGLLLRRQTRRRWEPRTLKEIFRLLPRLKEIYYEPWREWGPTDQVLTDRSSKCLFESLIPNQLKSIVLFEDFDDACTEVFHGVYRSQHEDPTRTADAAVTRALAEASLNLESLSASFIVDARYFFQARQPTWVWNKLVSLILTSRLLFPDESYKAIGNLLQAAAGAATVMPVLNAMELWNGEKGLAGVFRYSVSEDGRSAAITWRGNWDLPLKPQVVQSWKTVSLKHGQGDFHVVKELLDADIVIGSHGDAIHHLKFSHPVVHPVSLYQIRKVAYRYSDHGVRSLRSVTAL